MYADSSLINRAETVHRLGVCAHEYSLRTQNTFAEGAKPLTIQALVLKRDSDPAAASKSDEEKEAERARTILTFRGVGISVYFAALSTGFFYLLSSLAGSVAGSVATAQTVFGVVLAAYTISLAGGVIAVWNLMPLLVKRLYGEPAEKRLDTCMQKVDVSNLAAANL